MAGPVGGFDLIACPGPISCCHWMTYITLTVSQLLRSVRQPVSVRTERERERERETKMSNKISYSDCMKNGTWVGTFV